MEATSHLLDGPPARIAAVCDIWNLNAEVLPFSSHRDDTNILNAWAPRQTTAERIEWWWWWWWCSEQNLQQRNPRPLVLFAVYPHLLSFLWYVPDRCQRHYNEEDRLQRQLVQRQLAWTRRQRAAEGVTHWDVRGSSCICWTSSLYVWQGQVKGKDETILCFCVCLLILSSDCSSVSCSSPSLLFIMFIPWWKDSRHNPGTFAVWHAASPSQDSPPLSPCVSPLLVLLAAG